MPQRSEIRVEDIRKGDLIRVEFTPAVESHPHRALEYRAVNDGSGMTGRLDDWGTRNHSYFLLDRPAPAVELPTEDHHIGWLTAPNSAVSGPALGEWYFGRDITASGFPEGISRLKVTEWIPAIAVPTSALCDLRKQRHTWELGIVLNNDQLAIRHFLAAVDASKP